MEYYINVYKTKNHHYYTVSYDDREQAREDYNVTRNHQPYVHTIHIKGGYSEIFSFYNGEIFHKDFIIKTEYIGFAFFHKEYDLDDKRCGTGKTIEDCKEQIETMYLDGEV